MDDLEVDNELTATVVNDEGTDGATAVGEGIADTLEQTTLGDDGQTLLDITGLGHSDETAVITEVQDAVGLVDRAEHGLDDDGGGGVGDEAGLLLQLTGEEVDTEVTVLTGLGGDRDTDDLAGAALEDQDVANADKVAGDRDGLASDALVTGLHNADLLANTFGEAGWTTLVSDDFLTVMVVMVVEGVQNAVGSTLHATAEGVVLTLVVVVTHLARCRCSVSNSRLSDTDSGSRSVASGLRDLDFATGDALTRVSGSGLGLVASVVRDVDGVRRGVLVRVYGLVATVVRDVGFVCRRGPATVLSLSDVELILDDLIVDLRTVLLVLNRRLTIIRIAFTGQINLGRVALVKLLSLLIVLRLRVLELLRLLGREVMARSFFLDLKLDFFSSWSR